VSPIKFICLICCALLVAGCSRSGDQSHASGSTTTGASTAKAMTEAQALALLVSTLRSHKVAGLDCLAFASESDVPPNARADVWEFAAREVHDQRCGGDPATAPVRDRYQISASGKVLVYDVVNGEYKPL
jgi:hypothetical protein